MAYAYAGPGVSEPGKRLYKRSAATTFNIHSSLSPSTKMPNIRCLGSTLGENRGGEYLPLLLGLGLCWVRVGTRTCGVGGEFVGWQKRFHPFYPRVAFWPWRFRTLLQIPHPTYHTSYTPADKQGSAVSTCVCAAGVCAASAAATSTEVHQARPIPPESRVP